MSYANEVKEAGRIAWVGWTAGIVGVAIHTVSNGQLPVWGDLMYLTAGFAIIAALAAVTVSLTKARVENE